MNDNADNRENYIIKFILVLGFEMNDFGSIALNYLLIFILS